MDVVEFLFPLLSLAPDIVVFIIKCMDDLDILNFSLVSRRTKNLVASAGFTTTDMTLEFEEALVLHWTFREYRRFTLYLTEWNLAWTAGTHQPYDLAVYDIITVIDTEGDLQDVKFENPEFQIRDWIRHFMFIFNKNSVDILNFLIRDERFTFESISREISRDGVKHLCIPSAVTQVYKQQLIDYFQAPRITITLNTFPEYERILIRNHDLVCFEERALKLEDLLMTNSKAICIYYGQTMMKSINKFIKLWQKGSNPHLQCLVIRLTEVWLPQDLFNRIKYSEVNEDIEMRFPEFDDYEVLKDNVKKGGYSICDSKGERAHFYFQNDQIEMVIQQ